MSVLFIMLLLFVMTLDSVHASENHGLVRFNGTDIKLFETPFVRILIVLFGVGALALGLRAFISKRTKMLILQRQKHRDSIVKMMLLVANIVDSKNEYTKGHSLRVATYSRMIGERLGMAESELETLYYAALLHDIGKMGIPDTILYKKGPLTNEEYEIIKSHAAIGGELLNDITDIGDIAAGVKYHHERKDGKGYMGLRGDDIPLFIKILCACNALDSMLSDQPYRKAFSIEKTQSEFLSNAGTQFDEKITAVLISLITEGGIPL